MKVLLVEKKIVKNVDYISERGSSYNKVSIKRNKEYSVKRDISIYDKSENRSYINVRGRLCTATPTSITRNRTPPPPSQKHHFAQEHQINFCIDENHRAPSRREGADVVP